MATRGEQSSQGHVRASRSLGERQVAVVESALLRSDSVWHVKQRLLAEIAKPKYSSKQLQNSIPKIMEELGLTTELRNAVYSIYRLARSQRAPPLATLLNRGEGREEDQEEKASADSVVGNTIPTAVWPEAARGPSQSDELDCVATARLQWEEGICEELNALAEEQGRPLARLRTAATIASDEKRRDAMSSVEHQASRRFLFDGEDLLEAILQIEVTNRRPHSAGSFHWGLIKLHLHTPSIAELRRIFVDLRPEFRQMGVDEVTGDGGTGWVDERLKLGKRVSSAGYVAVIRQYARRGVPPSLRPVIWNKLLGLSKTHMRSNYFRLLQQQVGRVDCLVDQLFRMDVEHCLDDDIYFPFDELIETVMMVFSRDPSIVTRSHESVHPQIVGRTSSGESTGAVPPCGVQPFRGLVNYVAPLCFVYGDAEDAYFVFREMFIRYWCKLNAISTQPGSILHLSRLFEDLINDCEPELVHHLLRLGIPPLQIAFSWIQLAFVGYLQVDQILLLWDRMLGFEAEQGLLLLPVLAAAIFVFRSQALLRATDVQDVKDIVGDPTKLKVIPLLQHFLRASHRGPGKISTPI